MVFEAPLVDARGCQVGWMGSVIDVTERNRAIERERLAAERMAHLARLTSLGEIASSLAHQLNQPLMAIAGYNAGLRNTLQAMPDIDQKLITALDKQADQAAHAGRIVHRIREFLLRRAPQLEPCDLNEVVADAVALLQGSLQRQDIALELESTPRALPVRADAVLLGQVIVNLVRNAIDAIDAAGTERRIVLRTRAVNGAGARIEVRDLGPGLGGRSLEELAAPFFSSKPDGMGLGLAICRTVVEAHRGRLEAADAPGGGACFSVTLPLREGDDAA
jgi:two-component system sensor histidine kinase DctS